MKHGARNDLPAEVTTVKRGAVMCQVDVKLVGTDYKMSSVMTLESLDAMGLQTGDRVNVIAKAVNVLLTKG
jgi:molybdopterin-binding protein